ncbi:sugar ABC transporter ATP-binding protein [Kribbella caucasensis]|uniref:sugar ABC transporter ATP-binding protein n=1 Tax=Kribbella caucasensis TaxID=2512215 RepID=UPI00141529D1|nr:sugar ABC transporter ATP-binding protein [Kribbella sp. VKM Ac-2527]
MAVAGVSKCFGAHRALDSLTFDVKPGEVHALVGHNGSGKSTFVKVLSGFHTPEPGYRAAVAGVPMTLGSARAAHDTGLRFVHQELGLVDNLSVADNVLLGSAFPTRRLGRIDWTRARRQAADLLDRLGYSLDVCQPVAGLSPIHRTAVGIARAMHGDTPPHVLVLDEPTAALPTSGVAGLFDVVRRLQADGIGVIYISHHLDEVFEIADRVTVLRDGQHVATVPIDELDTDRLIELIVGKTVDLGRTAAKVGVDQAPVLEVRDLYAAGLAGVDFGVSAGEVVGIAGIAGSGRETVAGAVFGSLPRTGTVSVDGAEIRPERPERAIEAGLGYIGADRAVTGLIPFLSIRENLTLPRLDAVLRGFFLSPQREARDVRQWLQRVDIRPADPEKRADQLSGGNQQKVLLARWLRSLPRVLLIDEPTQGVDVGAVERIYQVIRQAAAREVSFVVSSSNSDELVALCNRVLVLSRGCVVGELSGTALTREAIDRACLTGALTDPMENLR